MIQHALQGQGAVLANDHVIAPFYPYFDAIRSRSGPRTSTKAKQLLAAAGVPSLNATLQYGKLHEIPDLAVLLQSQAAPAGINITPAGMDNGTFYGAQWCPEAPADPPCSGAAELGIVDYGHRATPDVFLNSALKTKGVWNSSQYSSSAFDAAFTEFQSAVGVDAQKAACTKIETDPERGRPRRHPVLLQLPLGQLEDVHRVSTRRPSGRCSSRPPRRPDRHPARGAGIGRASRAVAIAPILVREGRWPGTSRAGCSCRSSPCGCSRRSCSSSRTCCRPTSAGRSSARSRRRRASTRSTSGSARTARSSSSTLDSLRRHRHARFRRLRSSRSQAVLPQLLGAIGRSAKLAGLALFITIPHQHRRGALRRRGAVTASADRGRRARSASPRRRSPSS